MGQRLNVQLEFNKKETTVNCYYHWSGYTSSGLQCVQEVVNANKELKDTNNIVRGVKLLEATGASLTKPELEYAIANLDKSIHTQLKTSEHVDRNNGLIAISPEGVEDTLNRQEHMAIITLDKDNTILSIDISDLFYMDPDRYEEDDEPQCHKDLFTKDFDFNKLKPEQVDHVVSVIEKFDYNMTFTIEGDDTVYAIIA